MIVRLHSYPRSAETVIGRLLYGRRPKGVTADKGIMGPTVRMFDRGVGTIAFEHDMFIIDFHIHAGKVEDVEEMVRAIGGKRARVEVMTLDEWAHNMAMETIEAEERRERRDRDAAIQRSGDREDDAGTDGADTAPSA